MSEMLDLSPAADRMADVLENIDDDHLDRPTPCSGMPVRALVGHVLELSLAFEAAARKDLGGADSTPSPVTDELPTD